MSSNQINILLIEDDHGDADLLQEILSEGNDSAFTVKWVDRLQDGLKHLAQGGIDIVLSDLSLPDSQGLETFTRVFAQSPHVPVVILSGLADETIALQAVHEGAQDYLVKGEVNNNLLVRALHYAIERKRAQEALRESEERYALVARGVNDGLWDWNLTTDKIYYAPRWRSMLGYDPHTDIGNSPDEWFNRIHSDDRIRLRRELDAHLAGLTDHFKIEYRVLHKDGAYRWMLCRGLSVYGPDGRAYRMVGSQTDVTRRKAAEDKLRHDALHDTLTGLPNRALFVEHLERAIVQAKRRQSYLFAVLFLDLDRFKIINDSQGHLVGDQLLIAVAHRLQICLRANDTLARFGGDEFVILLDGVRDVDEAQHIASRIQHELSLPFNLGEMQIFTSASIGITVSTRKYEYTEDLLRDADTAMYQAKAKGKARYALFETGQFDHAVIRWQMETALRQALEQQEFIVYYQPIVSLVSGRIVGVEALLRWQHPQDGLLLPKTFISLAEETGLIVPIGGWLLRVACAQIRHWHRAGYAPLRVAVNISPRQVRDQNLVSLIKKVLAESGMPPQFLELEIVENTIVKNNDFAIESAIESLHELRTMGVQISIDDFGLGSSLICLKRLPLDTLKIDQSFVGGMLDNKGDATIVAAIIDMAHSLNLKVVAEGVETEEQLSFLRIRQSDEVQGYLFKQPALANEITKLLEAKGMHYLSATPQ
ncbi:MAG: EAL domain-containing protein [Chloroflexi bacterium]|nr:EAL domain-containing protein [Chloroflexota bacterium]